MSTVLDRRKLALETHIRSILGWLENNRDGAYETARSGVANTPERWAEAARHWFGGYDVDTLPLLRTFEISAPEDGMNEIVLVSNIPFYSHCEHHLAPFFGQAFVGYLPGSHIVGLSKIAKLVDAYARRLQVQERLTGQVADDMIGGLGAKGVGVVLHARHLCMESRGARVPGTVTTTSALRGVFKSDPAVRSEFLSLIPQQASVRL